jgi:hypothetical protein
MKRHVVLTGQSLFGLMEGKAPTLPYQSHSPTSRSAAALAKLKVGSQRWKVYQYLLRRGSHGAADFEGIADLKAELPTSENAYRPRRIELVDAGLAKFAGFTRTSPAGGECDCYVAVAVDCPDSQEDRK